MQLHIKLPIILFPMEVLLAEMITVMLLARKQPFTP